MKRIPLWCWATLVGLGAFLWVFTPWENVSERARTAAQNLGATSVYAEPGAPDVVNPERAEKVIGDRAIVVAVFDETPLIEYADEQSPRQALCRDVASLVPTNLVVVFAANPDGDYNGSYCHGPEFPAPTLTDDTTDVFFLSLFGHRGTVLAVPHQRDRPRPAAGGVRPRLRHRDVQGVRGGPPAWPGQQRLRRLATRPRLPGHGVGHGRGVPPAAPTGPRPVREPGPTPSRGRAQRTAQPPRRPGAAPGGRRTERRGGQRIRPGPAGVHDTDRQRGRQRLDAVERRIEKIEEMLL